MPRAVADILPDCNMFDDGLLRWLIAKESWVIDSSRHLLIFDCWPGNRMNWAFG